MHAFRFALTREMPEARGPGKIALLPSLAGKQRRVGLLYSCYKMRMHRIPPSLSPELPSYEQRSTPAVDNHSSPPNITSAS
jgi:hypothetical protein